MRHGRQSALTTTDDIYLNVYLDDELWRTIHIEYDSTSKTRIFNYSVGVNAVLLLGMIVISALCGATFRNTNAGVTAWLISSIIAGFINSQFLWLSALSVVYVVMKLIRTMIEDR